MSNFDFKGVITALVTPFKDGVVDLESFTKLVRKQIDSGIEGLVVNGTTGESPTLERGEVAALFKIAKQESERRIPVILGTGSNCTKTTIESTCWAAEQGADAALVVVPYYNKPPQRGLVAHFTAVADASPIPIILYDVPGRTITSMTIETVARLSQHQNIIGLKEASGSLQKVKALRSGCGNEFVLSSGDDSTCLEFMALGGDGVISVISHVVPGEMVSWSKRARLGEHLSDAELDRFVAINESLGIDTNPIPVKAAVYLQGIISSQELRLPLVAMEADGENTLREKLINLGLI